MVVCQLRSQLFRHGLSHSYGQNGFGINALYLTYLIIDLPQGAGAGRYNTRPALTWAMWQLLDFFLHEQPHIKT